MIAEGHAFAAISLVHGWDDWDIDREEWDDFFYQGSGRLKLLEDRQKLIDYLSATRGRYLVLECTGFADGRGVFDGSDAPSAWKERGWSPTFEIALEVGQKQISCMSRELLFAIDVMIAQRNCGLAPFEIPVPSQACVRERPSLNLEYLIDRIPQRTDIEQQLISAHDLPSGRPSLFLVVGDPDQGHRALIKRLENHDLPDFLDRLYPYANALLVRIVELPPSRTANFDVIIRNLLANALPNPKLSPRRSWKEIGEWLRNYRGQALSIRAFRSTAIGKAIDKRG